MGSTASGVWPRARLPDSSLPLACLPLCRSAPAPACCQEGWTRLQEGAVVTRAGEWGQHRVACCHGNPLLVGSSGERPWGVMGAG